MLVVGLAVAFLIVATDPDVSGSTLRQIHGDSASTYDVGGIYVAGWLSPEWNPFTEDRFRILTLLATVVYLTSVTAIGTTIVGAIGGVDRWPLSVRLLSGFLPGYLMVLAPLQLLFAGVPYLTASWISLVATPIIAVLLHRQSLTAAATGLRSDPGYRRRWLGAAAIIGGVLLLCGVHHLQSGRNFMVPDSIAAFLGTAGQQLQGVFGSHLAQWDQQSDEWVFNAPLVFTSASSQDFLFPFYASEFVALASFAALLFGIVHSVAVRRPRLVAALATGAVLAASPSIYPWNQISLVGGQNPTIWLGLPGRFVGIIAPWIALLLIGRQSTRTMVAVLFATAGLGFVTISGTVYVAVALVCTGAWFLLSGRGPARLSTLAHRRLIPVLALVAWAAPLVVYWNIHRTTAPSPLGWWLLAGAAAAMSAAVLLTLFASATPSPLPPLTRLAGRVVAWTAALGAGFIVSNNLVGKMADGQVRATLAGVLPGYDLPLQTRGLTSGISDLTFSTFAGQECAFTGHCVSFSYFLNAYGFISMLALAAWFALGPRIGGQDLRRHRAAWLVTMATFAVSFALVDFSGADQTTAWVLTRFIEVPYYALLGFAAVALVGSRSKVTAWAGGIVIVAWTVIPVANSHVVPQLARNADWLIGVIN